MDGFGKEFGAEIVEIIKAYIAKVTAPLEARIKQLEARIEVRYCGTWRAGETYQPGSLVTDRGSMWFCNGETSTRPGTPSSQWSLAVKSGAFGKDDTSPAGKP